MGALAMKMSIVDEILDGAEVSDIISVGDFQKKAIWLLPLPDGEVYSYIITEIGKEAMSLPELAEMKRKARSAERTKLYKVEGPVHGKLMPLSVKAFTGYPELGKVYAENMDSAEVKFIPLIEGTIELIGNGVVISASPRERFEVLENLMIKVDEVDETIAAAEAEGDRDTVRALWRAVRIGEKRLAAITRGKEKKNEDGQVSLF